jgi:putative ABC transport system permease protein
MGSFFRDVRYGIRTLARTPGFTAVVVLTLALGIGANASVFSLLNAVLLRPLPYHEPDRLVAVWQDNQRLGDPRYDVTPAAFRDWEIQNEVFAGMAAFNSQEGAMTVSGVGNAPERVPVTWVTTSFFDVLRVSPIVGRTFRLEDGNPDDYRFVVLSEGYWRTRLGADPVVAGRTITLERVPHVILGVVPHEVAFPSRVDMWLPFDNGERRWSMRGAHFLGAIARLDNGATLEDARANLTVIAERAARDYPGDHQGWGATVNSLHSELTGQVRPALLLLQGAALLVLLIACVNVANLQLVRSHARAVEFGVRIALGASRGRLVRQVLTESLLLATSGAALGTAVAVFVTPALVRLSPVSTLPADANPLDLTVLLAMVVAAIGTGVGFGISPAWCGASSSEAAVMHAARATVAGGRLHRALVAVEVALSLMLLVGAGLLLNSFVRLIHVDLGIEAESLLTARVTIPDSVYERPERADFFRRLHDAVKTIPGVESAGLISDLPLTGDQLWRNGFARPEHLPYAPGQDPTAFLRWVSPEYLGTVGLPLLRGRNLTYADTENTPHAILIDQAMARRFFPGENPLGKRLIIRYNNWEGEIVGMVGNARQASLGESYEPHMYVSFMQTYTDMFLNSMVVALHTATSPEQAVSPLRNAVRSLDPLVVPTDVETFEQRLAGSVSSQRFSLLLVGAFAAIALALAVIGLYGVIAYLVSQRCREFAIRVAFGAMQRDVLGLVLRHGLVLIGVGIAAGVCGVFAINRLLGRFLFGVGPTDPATIGAACVALTVTAVAAMLVPARRASKVDPAVALRQE